MTTFARSFSTVTCGLLLGSTAWAGLAVMPSIIKADTTSHAKMAVFNGLIDAAGLILPPVFLTAIASLGYLSYYSVGDVRVAYGVAAGSLVAALGLQAVILPINRNIQETLQSKKHEMDDGQQGGQMISQVLFWNIGRVVFSAIAFGAVIYASEYTMPMDKMTGRVMALGRPEYGLE